eukprot:1132778-Rhodomonas_salina.2
MEEKREKKEERTEEEEERMRDGGGGGKEEGGARSVPMPGRGVRMSEKRMQPSTPYWLKGCVRLQNDISFGLSRTHGTRNARYHRLAFLESSISRAQQSVCRPESKACSPAGKFPSRPRGSQNARGKSGTLPQDPCTPVPPHSTSLPGIACQLRRDFLASNTTPRGKVSQKRAQFPSRHRLQI